MPRDAHALVQHTHDQNTVVLRDVKDYVGLILNPPQSRCQFIGLPPLRRLLRQHLEPPMQTEEIDPRLFQSKMKDRVFVDALKIGGGLRRETITLKTAVNVSWRPSF